jgi:alpha-tubulin suppressor-like RCC1 family protein
VPDPELVRAHFLSPKPPCWNGAIPYPKKIVVDVAVGKHHMLVAARDNADSTETCLYATGLNHYGQLGLGDTNWHHELTKVLGSKDVQQVAAGNYHSLVLSQSGECLHAFGFAADGALGLGEEVPQFMTTPHLVTFPGSNPIALSSIACGESHSMAISEVGDIYSWGFNECGQTGHAHRQQGKEVQEVHRPTRVDLSRAFGQVKALQVCGGSQHSVFLVGNRE